ncbi:SAM-dependent methyltransferase, partial [Streptomyces sp. NPDC002530]
MTRTLVRHHPRTESSASADTGSRARDWAEIQERMLAPLYEAVYARLDVGPGTRMLSLGCGSGLALLIAAGRGALVTGVDTDRERLALARARLLPDPDAPAPGAPLLRESVPAPDAVAEPYGLITAFTPIGCAEGDADALVRALGAAVPAAGRRSTVVLTGWGPPERCATDSHAGHDADQNGNDDHQ